MKIKTAEKLKEEVFETEDYHGVLTVKLRIEVCWIEGNTD